MSVFFVVHRRQTGVTEKDGGFYPQTEKVVSWSSALVRKVILGQIKNRFSIVMSYALHICVKVVSTGLQVLETSWAKLKKKKKGSGGKLPCLAQINQTVAANQRQNPRLCTVL